MGTNDSGTHKLHMSRPMIVATAIAFIVYAVLSGVTLAAYEVTRERAESDASEHLGLVADGNAALIRHWFIESEGDIRLLGTTSRVREEFAAFLGGDQAAGDWLRMRLEAERLASGYVNITVYDTQGQARLKFGESSPGNEHLLAATAVRAASLTTGTVSTTHAAPDGEYHVSWFAPLRIGAGEPGGPVTTGVVMYEADLKQYLSSVVAPVNGPWPTTVAVSLQSVGGTYVASVSDDFAFSLVPEMGFLDSDAISSSAKVDGTDAEVFAFTTNAELSDSLMWERSALVVANFLVLFTFAAFLILFSRSERNRRRERLAKERIEDALHTQDRFLENMSHDLRTPLNSILGFSSLLKTGMSGPLNSEQQQQVDMINASGQHLLALVSDVLELSRLKAGEEEVDPETFKVADLVSYVSVILGPQVVDKGLLWSVDVPEDLEITTDRRLAERVLLHLGGNAIKFTANGGVDIKASLHAGNTVWISVHDTGPGLEHGTHREIMREFSQIPRPGAVKPQGSGLGLAIASRTAEVLGGEIMVASTPGNGATFTFVLPGSGAVS